MRDDPAAEQPEFRNLRNSWYHEVALRYPDDFEMRLIFSGWKVIQCYYSVYAAVSSLVRCVYPVGQLGQKKTLSIYSKEILTRPKFRDCFLPPVNLYIDESNNFRNGDEVEWKYGREHHVPVIEEGLRYARGTTTGLTTVLHYLKNVREWATYVDSYLLFRMYGESVKRNLDYSLQMIASFYAMQTETILIRAFGYGALAQQYAVFTSQLERYLGLKHSHLDQRFAVYQSILSGS